MTGSKVITTVIGDVSYGIVPYSKTWKLATLLIANPIGAPATITFKDKYTPEGGVLTTLERGVVYIPATSGRESKLGNESAILFIGEIVITSDVAGVKVTLGFRDDERVRGITQLLTNGN